MSHIQVTDGTLGPPLLLVRSSSSPTGRGLFEGQENLLKKLTINVKVKTSKGWGYKTDVVANVT